MSEVVRIGLIIIFHLSKLWKAEFSILCDVIFLVRLQEKFELDHGLGVRGFTAAHAKMSYENSPLKLVSLWCDRWLTCSRTAGRNSTPHPLRSSLSWTPTRTWPCAGCRRRSPFGCRSCCRSWIGWWVGAARWRGTPSASAPSRSSWSLVRRIHRSRSRPVERTHRCPRCRCRSGSRPGATERCPTWRRRTRRIHSWVWPDCTWEPEGGEEGRSQTRWKWILPTPTPTKHDRFFKGRLG